MCAWPRKSQRNTKYQWHTIFFHYYLVHFRSLFRKSLPFYDDALQKSTEEKGRKKKIISGLGNVFCFAQPLIFHKGIFFFWMCVFWLPAARHYKSPSVCYYLHSTIIRQKHQHLISGWFFSAIRNAIKLKNAVAVPMPRPDLMCCHAYGLVFEYSQMYNVTDLAPWFAPLNSCNAMSTDTLKTLFVCWLEKESSTNGNHHTTALNEHMLFPCIQKH